MLTREQNEAITRVEGDAPMGRLIRDHSWIPACLSGTLESGGAPRRVRLLGVDYVAFRDAEHRIGFLDEGCPHRSTSLVLARNEDCALTCIFHGWRVDVTGQVVDAPTHHPNADAFAAKIRTRAYPTVEAGGLVWVWLGEDAAPPFPHFPFTELPERQVWITATPVDCNWLQGIEATLDTAHVGTLHRSYITAIQQKASSGTIGSALDQLAPRYGVEVAPYGLDAIGLRPLPDGGTYVRTTRWVAPLVSLVPGNRAANVDGTIFIVSPVDDHHHVLFFGLWSNDRDLHDAQYADVPDAQRPLVGDRPFDREDFGGFSGGRDDNWGQNRAAMATGHFSGFTGNLLQEDIITQVSMGPVVDRTKEHLSSSDVAIIHARRVLLSALDRVDAGLLPFGDVRLDDMRHLDPIDAIEPPGE